LYAERAFALFLARLATRFDHFVLIGRLKPSGSGSLRDPRDIAFVGLPYYESLLRPLQVLRSMLASVRLFWRALDGADAVWLLEPHPLSVAFAVPAWTRRKRGLLGARHDSAAYIRSRHPRRSVIHGVAPRCRSAYAAIARRCPMVVVGPALARRYHRSRSLLELTVSLIEDGDLIDAEIARSRSYGGELTHPQRRSPRAGKEPVDAGRGAGPAVLELRARLAARGLRRGAA
jgi:hypothetical protein